MGDGISFAMFRERECQLAESRRLTDKMNATRKEWDAGKGKDYGTALDFIISQGRRRVIIADLRSTFRLIRGGKR